MIILLVNIDYNASYFREIKNKFCLKLILGTHIQLLRMFMYYFGNVFDGTQVFVIKETYHVKTSEIF